MPDGGRMESFREDRCRRCQSVFYLCRRDDRGQAYCGQDCQEAARAAIVRAARTRHRLSEAGRADHRDRMRAFRVRQREKRPSVMDLGSEKVARDAIVALAAEPASTVDAAPPRQGARRHVHEVRPVVAVVATGEVRCAVCGQRSYYVRSTPRWRWRRPSLGRPPPSPQA